MKTIISSKLNASKRAVIVLLLDRVDVIGPGLELGWPVRADVESCQSAPVVAGPSGMSMLPAGGIAVWWRGPQAAAERLGGVFGYN